VCVLLTLPIDICCLPSTTADLSIYATNVSFLNTTTLKSFCSSESLSIAGSSTLLERRVFLGAGFFERDALVSAGVSLTLYLSRSYLLLVCGAA
jgi:hypothetical protein